MISRVIRKAEPKEATFKALVQDFFRDNPSVDVATISIVEGKPKRSEAQSRLYFFWKDFLAEEMWGGGNENKKEMHKTLKDNHLNGESTKDLNVLEFVDFLCDVEDFANSEGIKLPHTGDFHFAFYGKIDD